MERTSQLMRVLEHKVTPWIDQYGLEHLIVALPTLKEMRQRYNNFPQGIYLTERPHLSERTSVKSSNSTVTARWPEDGLHSSTTPVLGVVIEGNVAIPFGDYVLHCKPSHFFLIPPGTPYPDGSHLCIEAGEQHTQASMFSIREWQGGVSCWINHKSKLTSSNHEACNVFSPKTRQLLHDFTEEMLICSPYHNKVCNGLLTAAISLVMREIQQRRTFKPLSQNYSFGENIQDSYMESNTSITRAVEYMKRHLHDKLTIDQVASYVYMSRAHFTRQFLKGTGMTFSEYLTQLRLDTAKVLLMETTLSVQEVSKYIGVSVNYCILLFRKNMQMTPTEFRQQLRKTKDQYRSDM